MAIKTAILHSRAAIIIFAAAAMLCVAMGAAVASAPVSAQDVAEGLTCQCGCGLTVANCNHPQCEFSVPVREQIAAMIGRGMAGPEIIAYFRHKYGEKILSSPTTQGFNLLAWVMPFAALIGGGAIIVVAVSRWRQAPPSTPSPGASDTGAAVYDDELRSRLQRDLKEKL
ncbi:MAG TPA: cytochrome c-type biogenesis protein CcmH [Candidatus Binataceae bacterium]|nr:cytochrome c-type biogenesis protein CcmH [Candidatus Binataceae bacterium]